MWLNIFKKWKKDSWNNIYTKLGNPGIAIYVKKKYYSDTLIFLEQSNQFHDLSRTNGFIEIGYKKFEYKSEITHCDFSKELLRDNDTIILIWCVDKKFQKKN